MPVKALDHVTIRTTLLEETVAFYSNIIRLRSDWRPSFRFPGAWMYAQDKPVLHLLDSTGDDTELLEYLSERDGGTGSGNVDHFSFACEDLEETKNHLNANGVEFRERVVPEIQEHQLFIKDPNGIVVEMIFTTRS